MVSCLFLWAVWAGGNTDVIDVDAAQYAAISMEMLQNNSWLQVFQRGVDYLDKPPLLFWLSALSFKLFGYSNLAYKLPTLLASLLTLFYTYKLALHLYNRQVARIAALLLGTAVGFLWANNDVKTDALMTSCIIFSAYQLIRYVDGPKLKFLLAGSVGIGLGMMAKGPMGLIFPLTTVFVYALLNKNIIRFFSWHWLLLPLVVAVVISPMLWGLYQQFDLQPHKVVNGKTGSSGLHFFFWEQSFGRITGENVWRNNTSFFYLFHSFALLFLPFSFLVLGAGFQKIKRAWQTRQLNDLALFLASLLMLMALSLSSYKIPHYVLVVFPLAAVVLASEMPRWELNTSSKWLRWHHWLLIALSTLIGVGALLIFEAGWLVWLGFVFLLYWQLKWLYKRQFTRTLIATAVSIGFVFNVHVMPAALQYAQGKRLANLVTEVIPADTPLYFWNRSSYATEFYLGRRLEVISGEMLLAKHTAGEAAWYYMSADGREALLDLGLTFEAEHELWQYDLNRISFKFLNPYTRNKQLDPRYLVKLRR
jgi:hypothetical protein